jgi:biotin transport system substrate-specific component
MLFAALAVGLMADLAWDRHLLSALAGMAIGTVLVYTIGATWLAHALDVPLRRAWELGIRPFLVGDAIKMVLAGSALPAAWRLVDRVRD